MSHDFPRDYRCVARMNGHSRRRIQDIFVTSWRLNPTIFRKTETEAPFDGILSQKLSSARSSERPCDHDRTSVIQTPLGALHSCYRRANLDTINLESGKRTAIGEPVFGDDQFKGVRVHPDGDKLTFWRGTHQLQLWVLEGIEL